MFTPGLDLCAAFFDQIARPLLAASFPHLSYSAGLLGWGSDVLGFDDETSTDHMWGPRFYLFLPEADFGQRRDEIAHLFSQEFPYAFGGYSTHFGPPDPMDNGVRQAMAIDQGPVNPLVEFHTLKSFCANYLGLSLPGEISAAQWLTTPEHRLLGFTAGRVFHDDLGLGAIRQQLAYFPRDIWLWMMTAQWDMVGEEIAFMGRCGSTGDELGSRIVATRQVQRLMRLAFLQARQYAPYSKWFGTAFNRLAISSILQPLLAQVLAAQSWPEREIPLNQAYQILGHGHNELGITPPVETELHSYFGRPFQIMRPDPFVEALLAAVESPQLRTVKPIGSVSQFTDSTAVHDNLALCAVLKELFQDR